MLDVEAVSRRYRSVRAQTEALARPLSAEDMMVQSMPDASPTKWHLAHTSWFFAEFVLSRIDPSYEWPDPRWRVMYNSYYAGVGPSHPRAARGVLSRPSLDAVLAFRADVDLRVQALLAWAAPDALSRVLLGTHHEQQHQELLLTDVKHALSCNPMGAAYASAPSTEPRASAAPPLAWLSYDEREATVGHPGGVGFAFDNERPAHRVIVGPFLLASRLVTNAEYAAFIDDGGYKRPELWLADGWATLASRAPAPLYWEHDGHGWRTFTLHGPAPIDADAPALHLSFFEADAYARWAGARLPTEHEWEIVAAEAPPDGNFLERGLLEPERASAGAGPAQLFGDAWEWTGSAYRPYPRFQPADGVLGEYNGKFMSGQMVLRGGSCLSPASHIRATYRNYFPPDARWQATGIRLARDR